MNLYTYCYNDPTNLVDPSGNVPIVPILLYLGETAIETAPDILLDRLLDGDDFVWWKSALSNFGQNLIPGLGESKKALKIAKIIQKYGPEVAEFIVKHGDEALEIFEKEGIDGLTKAIRGASNKFDGVRIINKKYAGQIFNLSGDLAKKYPNGVKFNTMGFPDFSPYAKVKIKIKGLKGNTTTDFTAANKAAGLTSTPAGYTWHHVEDGETMMLVPTDLHQAVRHTGGASLINKGLAP